MIQQAERREKIYKILKDYAQRFQNPLSFPITENNLFSLASGPLGMVVIYNEFSKLFSKEKNKKIAHQYLAYCNSKLNNMHLTHSPWFGFEAISTVVQIISKNDKRNYENYAKQLDNYIFNMKIIKEYINRLDNLLIQKNVHKHHYDAIYGMSSLARYMIFRNDNRHYNAFIDVIVSYLTDVLTNDNEQILNCYIPFHNQTDMEKQDFPYGHLDLSLSHGIAGPLALLSIYSIHVNQKNQKVINVINDTIQLLKKLQMESIDGKIWPKKIQSFSHQTTHVRNDSWCYGEEGIARALYLASKAINDKDTENLAINVYKQICSISPEQIHLQSTTFCHGYAGLAHMFNQMYNDTGINTFKKYGESLIDYILHIYNEKNKYKELKKEQEKPGILEGEGGIMLTLTSYLLDKNDWDWLFLIN
ncbi:MAG TPA: lanthionine synthetase C family protein [Cerasibacillus sp.]|uniref:lanthionine synthetase C family protein n=1 Tax=Cerasibacillus sp. TaxID=2498711 RepID=UPI002F4236C8